MLFLLIDGIDGMFLIYLVYAAPACQTEMHLDQCGL